MARTLSIARRTAGFAFASAAAGLVLIAMYAAAIGRLEAAGGGIELAVGAFVLAFVLLSAEA